MEIYERDTLKTYYFLPLVLCLPLNSCSHFSHRDELNSESCQKSYYNDLQYDLSLASANKKVLGALKFEKIDNSTIKFTGTIEAGDSEVFKTYLSNNPQRLIVKSTGGNAQEALKMAKMLKNSTIKEIIVDRFCLSSCASYLFLAVEKKWIREGIVGFHGNMTALINDKNFIETLLSQTNNKLMSEKNAPKWIDQNKNTLINEEQDFLKSLGVSQTLFDLSQKEDKGQKDGKSHAFLLPGIKTFAKYGIKNVRGRQLVCLGHSLEMNNVYLNK